MLQSSEGVRAALDEERAAVAQLHADLARRHAQMMTLMARASDGGEGRGDLYIIHAFFLFFFKASSCARLLDNLPPICFTE